MLSFQPAQDLPPNVCIEVNVTSAVVDLSGKPAQPQTFQFTTLVLPLVGAWVAGAWPRLGRG